VHKVFTESML